MNRYYRAALIGLVPAIGAALYSLLAPMGEANLFLRSLGIGMAVVLISGLMPIAVSFVRYKAVGSYSLLALALISFAVAIALLPVRAVYFSSCAVSVPCYRWWMAFYVFFIVLGLAFTIAALWSQPRNGGKGLWMVYGSLGLGLVAGVMSYSWGD